jgi:hypothetical protein
VRAIRLSHPQCQFILASDFSPAEIQADVAQTARPFDTTPPPRTVVFEIAHGRAEAFRATCTTRLAQVGFDESYKADRRGPDAGGSDRCVR